MTATTPIREGFHTITTYLIVREAEQLIDFVKEAFGATEMSRSTGSAGGLHAEVRIGDSMLMVGGGNNVESGETRNAAFYLYMRDVDAVYARALKAGGISTDEPADKPYGERQAGVKDRFGNQWWIGEPLK